MTLSNTSGFYYIEEDMVYFKNPQQAYAYMNWGCKIIDLFCGSDKKLVYVFQKIDHEIYGEKWRLSKECGNKVDSNEE